VNVVLGLAVFAPAILMGMILVHLIWDDARASALWLKLFLGIGVGLGLNSVLYFGYLLLFAGHHFFLLVEAIALVILLGFLWRRERSGFRLPPLLVRLSTWQVVLLTATLAAVVFSISGALTVWGHRPSGTWDAFMIYNRAARFIFRSQASWLQSFSSRLDPVFHADYPLLIPLNVASAWELLNRESPHAPAVFSGLLMLATSGLLASAVTLVKSASQAALALIVLLNTPFFVVTGASQTADVPLAFYVLATAALIFLYFSGRRRGLLVLAGLTCGLAAWTKNEGQLFVIVSAISVVVLLPAVDRWKALGSFLLGLASPLAAAAYFKLFVAPPNDLLSAGIGPSIELLLQWQRHVTILLQYGQQVLSFGESWIWVGFILLGYALLVGFSPISALRRAYWLVALIMTLQLAGYYVVYLITPHPIDWQLESSLERLFLHVYPALLFVWFALITDVAIALRGNAGSPAQARAA
jgi:hypothetical protein